MLAKLNPAVPRYFLFALAGALWTAAGVILCVRGASWMGDFSAGRIAVVESAALALAAGAYVALFARLVRRNIERIHGLPERACVFAFTPWRGYLMIGIMMTAGISLRTSALPPYYLSLPYTAMGAVLLAGSVVFYREFFRTVPVKR